MPLLRQPPGHRAGVGRTLGGVRLVEYTAEGHGLPHALPPLGLASRRATSSGVSTCSAPAPSRAHTRSGRWQTAPTACPTASMPATAATASAQGDHGLVLRRGLEGQALGPVGLHQYHIGRPAQLLRSSRAGELVPRNTVPTVTTPCSARAARRRSGVGSSTRGQAGVAQNVGGGSDHHRPPAVRRLPGQGIQGGGLAPAPTRATIRWRAISRPNCSQMPMLSSPTGAR